jgi:methyl-accepting chemotaxis protein
MSAILQSGTVAPAVAAAAPTVAGGFFAHHGFWAPGVRLFRKLSFATKALIISLAFVLPFLGLLGWQLMADAELAMQGPHGRHPPACGVAHGVLVGPGARGSWQAQPRRQQAQARQLVSGLLRGQQYFWINDMQQRMVMHAAKPDLDGKDMSTMKDPNGLAVFGAFVDMVRKSGQGFVHYQWPKAGSELPVDKLSYVKGFAPWGWVIGSGIYVGELRAAWLRQVMLDGAIVLLSMALAA